MPFREWTDRSWLTVAGVQGGLDGDVRTQRSTLFGPNTIDIEAKSTTSLLVDEVNAACLDLNLIHD